MGTSISTQGLDSYVRRDHPLTTFSGNQLLRVNNHLVSTALSYVWRVPPDLPRGAVVLSARLVLTQQYDQASGAVRDLVVHRVAEKVDVQRVTWDTIPEVVGQDSRTVTKTGTPRYTEWVVDVTEHLQAVADGEPWWGWRLSTPQAAELAFFSYEAPASVRPRLEVEWSDAPHAPTGLTPGDGQVVAVPRPVLRSQFSDVAGDVTLSAVQVQINGTDSWATPAWDSGTVVTNQPELDLNAAGYAGIVAGGSVWWRMRHRDGAGVWSDWSDAVQVTYRAPVTLTVTGPASLTEDASPAVTWTVTGGTQTAWRVLVYDLRTGVRLIWDSGQRSGTATAAAIPATALAWDDHAYRVEVRVWDAEPRVATPGVPVWRSATRDFVLDRDGSQTPTTDLAAVRVDDDHVAVRLTWSRASAPEGWVVARDGVTVAHLDADGTVGEFIDFGAAPRTTHAYEVSAIVGGKVGPPAQLATSKSLLNTTGVWLVDPVDGQRVLIFQEGLGEWALAEDTVVHEPRGHPGVVPVTRTLGGARGTVTGDLVDTHDIARYATKRTYQEWVDAWLDLRERTGTVLRLIATDRNIPVVVWNMTERPVAYGSLVRSTVQASWAQAGEYAGGPR